MYSLIMLFLLSNNDSKVCCFVLVSQTNKQNNKTEKDDSCITTICLGKQKAQALFPNKPCATN